MTVKLRSLLSGLLLFTAVLAAQRVESSREIRRQHVWTQGQRVEISHRLGDLMVRGTNAREVQVFAMVRTSADDKAEADKLASQIDVTLESTPSALIIRTRYPEENRMGGRRRISFSVRLEVSMPFAAPLQSENSFGRTELLGLRGGVDVTNRNGSLRDSDGAGTHKLTNSFGAVDVSNIRGAVTLSGANGSATVMNVDELSLSNRFGKTTVQTVARNVIVQTNNGAIEVFDVGGPAIVGGSFGSANVARVKGGLTLKNQNGSVEVRSITGNAQISNSFGSISFSDISGQVIVSGQNGKVTGMKAGGPVEVKSSFGGVELTGMQQGARVTSGNSHVTVQDVNGETYVQTSFGTATVIKANGGVTVVNQNGAVRVNDARGPVNAKTSFGAIEIQGAGGAVDVTASNGSVTIAGLGQKCQPVTARTSFGSMRVAVPSGVGYDFSAATTFGRVKTDFEVTLMPGSQQEGRLEGKISGGGCPLKLSNSNGSIEITKGQ